MTTRSRSRALPRWPADVHTLAIDVGGTGLKAAVLDAKGEMITERAKVDTPYPCPPTVLIPALTALAASLNAKYDRVSVGFPGLVRGGRVYNIPALSRLTYGGEPDPHLVEDWHGFDLAAALAEAFSVPVKVANDADVQGCAVVSGNGLRVRHDPGHGVGTSLFSNGILLPHLELGHAPFRKGETVEDQLGNAARKTVGNERWEQRVLKAIEAYDQFLFFDHVYLGGGNSAKLIGPLPPKASVVSNTAGHHRGPQDLDHGRPQLTLRSADHLRLFCPAWTAAGVVEIGSEFNYHWRMLTEVQTDWLTEEQQRAWRSWLMASLLLPEQLERDLKHSHGLSNPEYEVMVRLSESPGRRLRMSELASKTQASKSRLSHQISRMESDGLVRREDCPEDRRGAYAVLTEAGWERLVEAAPAHVASVRHWLVDALSPEELIQLGAICARVVERIQNLTED